MQAVLDTAEIAQLEEWLVGHGLSEDILMLRAGAAVAEQASRFVDEGSVVVLCGMGKNAGDGWVVADRLAAGGGEVAVVTAAAPALMKSELARKMANHAVEMGIPVHVGPTDEQLASLLSDADVVVDAVFGTGLRGAMPAPYSSWAELVDDEFLGTVVSVDVPSGVDADTGAVEGACFNADLTVTMFAVKPGLISGAGCSRSGTIAVAHIASREEGLPDLDERACFLVAGEGDFLDALPEPDPECDKYGRGRVLVVGGSARYPGAAVMAARAAARSGAGYVTLAVPRPVVGVAQSHLLDVVVVGLPDDGDGAFSDDGVEAVRELASHADVVLAGPGMTTSFGACEFVRALLAQDDVTLVLDADGLNAAVKICAGSLAEHPDVLRRRAPLVLTPHRRELARLAGLAPDATASLAEAVRSAQAIVWSVGSNDFYVLSKGPQSAVVGVDAAVVVPPGPDCLATAGSGDVLAGMVAGVLATGVAAAGDEGMSGIAGTLAAVDRAHAIAGDLAAERFGSRGVVATDLIDCAGLALDELAERSERAALADGEPTYDGGYAPGGGDADGGAGLLDLDEPDLDAGGPAPSGHAAQSVAPAAPDLAPMTAREYPEAMDMTLVEPDGLVDPGRGGPSVSRVPEVEPAPSIPPFLAEVRPVADASSIKTAFDDAAARREGYHESATLRIDAPGAAPLDERPSARQGRSGR